MMPISVFMQISDLSNDNFVIRSCIEMAHRTLIGYGVTPPDLFVQMTPDSSTNYYPV
jgi:hypothetical protein